MLSLSTGSGVQVGLGCTGDVMLPSRIEVGKHSRITAEGNQGHSLLCNNLCFRISNITYRSLSPSFAMSSRGKPPQRHTASSDQDRLCQTCNKAISLVGKSDALSTWDSQVRQWRKGTHRRNIQHGHLDLEFAQLLLLLLLVVSLLVF